MDSLVKSLTENLRREYDYCKREKSLIQDLYTELIKTLDELFREWWILQAQKETATNYLKCFKEEGSHLSQRFFELDRVHFVKAFSVVNYEEFKYVDLLKALHSKPELIVHLLLHAQDLDQILLQNLCFIIYTGVYGSCICNNDDDIFVDILHHLIRLQVGPSNKPRKILKSGNIAFTLMLRIYIENTSSAKRFLTAALHKPVVQLIMQDDWYLDISPSQVLERLSPEFQAEKFGKPGTKEFDQKVASFREELVTTLANLTQDFIKSIRDNLYLFPNTYLKLLNYLAEEVTRAGYLSSEEVQTLCTEFVFECFLYPAIVDPETYGVTSDFVISSIARHNLMEVGRILQTFIYQHPTNDTNDIPSPYDLFSKFPPNSMTDIVRSLLSSARNLFSVKMEQSPSTAGDYNRCSIFDSIWRSVALLTPSGLDTLVHSLRSLFRSRSESVLQYHSVFEILLQLPDRVAGTRHKLRLLPHLASPKSELAPSSSASVSPVFKKKSLNSVASASSNDLLSGVSPNDESGQPQVSNCAGDSISHILTGYIEEVLIFSLEINNECPGMLPESKVMESERLSHNCMLDLPSRSNHRSDMKAEARHRNRKESNCSTASTTSSSSHSNSDLSVGCSSSVSAGPSSSNAGIGAPSSNAGSLFLPVNQLSQSRGSGISSSSGPLLGPPSTTGTRGGSTRCTIPDKSATTSEIIEKRTRFSLSNDQEAFSAAADNLEAVSEMAASEIASTHSAPSVDLESQEDEADALSDMISANVSGRGTPSIISGGRESPLSGTELPVTLPKNDVTDKFGKFDIPHSRGGETEARSTVSDTWSTDVLASDSETTETAENQQRLVEIMEEQTTTYQLYGTRLSTNSVRSKNSPNSRAIRNQENSSRSAGGPAIPAMVGEGWTVEDTRHKALERLNDFINEDVGFSEQPIRSSGSNGRHNKSRNRTKKNLTNNLHTKPAVKCNHGDDQDDLDISEDLLSVDDDLVDSEHLNTSHGPESVPPNTLPRVGSEQPNQVHNYSSSLLYASKSSDQLQQHQFNTVISTANFENSAFTPPEKSRKDSFKTKSTSRLTAPNRESSPVKLLTRSSSSSFDVQNSTGHTSKSHRSSKLPDQSEKVKQRGSSFFEGFSRIKERIGKSNQVKNRDSSSSSASQQSKVDSGVTAVSEPNKQNDNQITNNSDLPGEAKESVEDMLNRYKQKANEKVNQHEVCPRKLPDEIASCQDDDAPPEPLFFDADNLTGCPAWQDAKRKLRLVLSSVTSLPLKSENLFIMEMGPYTVENYLMRTLNAFLADAINQQEGQLCTQIQETMRVIRMFNAESLMKLLKSMEKDCKERQAYLSYLMTTREQLGISKQRAHELVKRCSRNRSIATRHMMSMCIQELIQLENSYFTQFASQFQILSDNPTSSTEEKQQLVMGLLRQITTLMQNMPFYSAVSEETAAIAEQFIERMVMSQIYRSTMCLNDTRVDNDRLFHEAISSLAKSVTLQDLQIPRKYYSVIPFESAQNELLLINSYKTPQDKMQCIKRVNSNIMNMLRMANASLIPCADDILPVSVFVIIQANPPHLQSNMNYIETFYESRLDGESQYILTQFKAGIEVIKKLISDNVMKNPRQFDHKATYHL